MLFLLEATSTSPRILFFAIVLSCLDKTSPEQGLLSHKYSTRVVLTKYGPLRGVIIQRHFNQPPVEAFLGVPYATPPLGSLRYMPPVTPSMWKNTRLADSFSPVCPQNLPEIGNRTEALLKLPRGRLFYLEKLLPLLANQSEDCLYLNIYVPRGGVAEEDAFPVVVYVHGESYEWNSGNPYDGSVLAGYGNVIVVTINFRLGILGFLKTGTRGSVQGNFGLMDLVAGLHWLRENIPAFSGDPERITMMGHGTGAALSNFIAVSPVAKDLLHRVILLSGSGLSPWALQREPLSVKRKVAEKTGCHGDLLEDDLAPCLRLKPLPDLLSVRVDPPRFLAGFAPFIDGAVLTSSHLTGAFPDSSLLSGISIQQQVLEGSGPGFEFADFPDKDLLFSLTSTESYLDVSAQDLEFGFNETRRDRILRTFVRNCYYYHLNEIFSTLKNEYTDWERPTQNPLSVRDSTLEVLSDGHTVAPLVRVGYLHALRGGKSFFLHFDRHSGERDFPQKTGSVHGEDVPYVLGLPLVGGQPYFPHNYSLQDGVVSRTIINYISNFARQGNTFNFAAVSTNHLLGRMTVGENFQFPLPAGFELGSPHAPATRFDHSVGCAAIVLICYDIINAIDWFSWTYRDPNTSSQSKSKAQEGDVKALPQLNVPERKDSGSSFWDTYDSINQLYLEISGKNEMKSHYRGHKMSLWLNLIPQLHRPGVDDLNMRHHHFQEESAQYYDGSVRPQSLQRPSFAITSTASTAPPTTLNTAETPPPTQREFPSTTECPPNVTGSAVSQNTIKPPNNNHNLFRKLASSHYQSYTTALTVTIAVGCFLLLLNILIFAGIYHQRDRSGSSTFGEKTKEEMIDIGSCSSSSGEGDAKQAVGPVSPLSPHGRASGGSSLEISLQEFKCEPPSATKKSNCTSPLPPSYEPPPEPMKLRRLSSSGLLGSPCIPEPPPPPRAQPPSLCGGILRQGGTPQTPSCSKKRVQIQEISV